MNSQYGMIATACIGILAASIVLSACGPEDDGELQAAADRPVDAASQPQDRPVATYDITDADGTVVGRVTLTDGAGGMLLETEIDGLAPGEHGFHLHETGVCEPPFESAGGHFAPGGRAHGLLSDEGPHAGDLPNLVVGEEASTTVAHTWVDGLSIGVLTEADGSALVVHADPDDYRTDPAGAAGDRVACAEIVSP
ncbi:MAG: superoxide dismutase family protein [Gemmatimonadota bacterium]